MARKILAFGRDPGAANAVGPVCHELIEAGVEVQLYGKDYAGQVFTQMQLPWTNFYSEVPHYGLNPSGHSEDHERKIVDWLREKSVDAVLTGTSGNDMTEKYLWRACEILGLKSFAVLDNWMNLVVRFSSMELGQLSPPEAAVSGHAPVKQYEQCTYFPTLLFVPDKEVREQLINLGVSGKHIYPSGQPYFEYLKKDIDNYLQNYLINTRKNNEMLFLFGSQPLSELYGGADKALDFWGYNELVVFEVLVEVLTALACESKKKIRLRLRLHPKERFELFMSQMMQARPDPSDGQDEQDVQDGQKGQLLLEMDTHENRLASLLECDGVLGMSSVLLLEAALMGKPIFSVQLGLKQEDPFILGASGKLETLKTRSALEKKMRAFIFEGRYDRANFLPEKGAAQKIKKVLEAMIWQY